MKVARRGSAACVSPPGIYGNQDLLSGTVRSAGWYTKAGATLSLRKRAHACATPLHVQPRRAPAHARAPCRPHLVREARVLVPRLHELPPDGVELAVVCPQQRAVPGLRGKGGDGVGGVQRARLGNADELRPKGQVAWGQMRTDRYHVHAGPRRTATNGLCPVQPTYSLRDSSTPR